MHHRRTSGRTSGRTSVRPRNHRGGADRELADKLAKLAATLDEIRHDIKTESENVQEDIDRCRAYSTESQLKYAKDKLKRYSAASSGFSDQSNKFSESFYKLKMSRSSAWEKGARNVSRATNRALNRLLNRPMNRNIARYDSLKQIITTGKIPESIAHLDQLWAKYSECILAKEHGLANPVNKKGSPAHAAPAHAAQAKSVVKNKFALKSALAKSMSVSQYPTRESGNSDLTKFRFTQYDNTRRGNLKNAIGKIRATRTNKVPSLQHSTSR